MASPGPMIAPGQEGVTALPGGPPTPKDASLLRCPLGCLVCVSSARLETALGSPLSPESPPRTWLSTAPDLWPHNQCQ